MDDDPFYLLLINSIETSVSGLEVFGYLGTFLLLLLFSGLVSGSEVAFFSLSSKEIIDCASSEKRNDRIIAKLLMDPKRILASILIFNNLINVAIVTLATFFTWNLVGKEGFLSTFIPTVVVTILIVFLGEILPKVYASNNSMGFARGTAKLLNLINSVFFFLAYPLIKFSSLIEKRIETKGYDVSLDELNEAIELAADDETTDEEKDILRGIVNFSSIQVKQVMIDRTEIFMIDYEDDFHQVMDKVNKHKLSRIPVYKENIDQLEGILHVKDLLPFITNDEKFNWRILLRSVFYIPESKKIDDLLRNFQEKHVHMAIVVDEYGGTSGLVTLEDVVEEIVGEINDEFDSVDVDYTKLDTGTYIFEGKTSLNDIIKLLDLKQDVFDDVKGENESIGGLLLEINSSMPKINEPIYFSNYEFLVVSANHRRIKKVKFIIHEKKEHSQ